IPLWLSVLPVLPAIGDKFSAVPITAIVVQLAAFMVFPMVIGMLLRRSFPNMIEKGKKPLRRISLGLLALVLSPAIWTVRESLLELAASIAVAAATFILVAMAVG